MSFKINNRRYTGCKAKITNWINEIIDKECAGAESFCDIFAGTGVVTDAVINRFNKFIINDFLYSNEIIYYAFFGKQDYQLKKLLTLKEKYRNLDPIKLPSNYVSDNYGGKFFSEEDALKIGFIREDLEARKKSLNKREYAILLASLIYSFDRSANTVGHYEAYIKGKQIRSSFNFELINPVITGEDDPRDISIYRQDANKLIKKIKTDILYIDPPYSSRQYSRFYHVIETIVKWDKPQLFGAALKPAPENMSEYCSSRAIDAFTELIEFANCKYILDPTTTPITQKVNLLKTK